MLSFDVSLMYMQNMNVEALLTEWTRSGEFLVLLEVGVTCVDARGHILLENHASWTGFVTHLLHVTFPSARRTLAAETINCMQTRKNHTKFYPLHVSFCQNFKKYMTMRCTTRMACYRF